MLLKDKTALVYGAGGAVGGAVARAFAREGAKVFLSGRTLAKVENIAKEISRSGGFAEATQVDALDEGAVERHIQGVVKTTGRVDISFNAIGIPQEGIQGIPLAELSAESFCLPIATYTRSHFVTATAAARRMIERQCGVILIHTPEPPKLGVPFMGGMSSAWAAMEALSRNLSAEFGPQGVRFICLRSTGLPETKTIDVVFGLHAKALNITRKEFQTFMEDMSHTRRSTTLEELANAAVFAASDKASGMTGATINLTGGKIVD